MAIELSTPSFKPREYEGEYILYTLYGLDSDGDELDDIITSPKKSTVIHTIKELRPDYRRIYNGMHVTAILYDKNDRMLDSEVVWSTDQNESKGANETIEYEKGHKNSRGEDAPWVIRDHKNGNVLASFSKKDDAEAHLERMKHYSKGEKLFNKQELESMAMNGYKAAVTAAWSGAGVKNFKIDIRINEEEPPTLDVRPKTLDGKDIDVSWRLLPNIMKIAQYSISPVGNHTIEREMDFATEDDVEKIFTDEFKSLDDVLEHGKPSESANEDAPAKNEGRVTSYFVLHKNAKLDAIEKIVATLEDAILNDQTVETTANPDGTVSLEIYGRMSPDDVARAMQLPGQLGTSYVDLAINIEG